MNDFVGKVVVVAGALGTVGVGIAEQFRARGATIRIVEDDIGNPVVLERHCDAIAAEHGRLDLVVLCHGTHPAPPPRADPAPHPAPGRAARWRARLSALGQAIVGLHVSGWRTLNDLPLLEGTAHRHG